VEIKSIAREAGFRSKVAVAARQDGIDPVGCCVGLRGIRIQNIVNELGGEKIDVIGWNPDQAIFIANALSPAQVVGVRLNEKEKAAVAIIPDKQLSLAIGKEGQNVRLAVKLTGWRIDIKSASEMEQELAAIAAARAERAAAEALEEDEEAEETREPTLVGAEAVASPGAEPVAAGVGRSAAGKTQIRFVEDILPAAAPATEKKTKKKKGGKDKKGAEDGIRLKKKKRSSTIYEDDEEY
jgi:N utilization substance protein A